ncbi:hypothetical protein AYO50_02575 [Acidobacteria bacterium SCGC AG-212-P17]|nr:hypothetical protein AYO50_02575 [Acidobacteria bacterium SCGC AG-212-P17]
MGPPGNSAVLQCLCCGSTYRYGAKDIGRGVPKRNPTCLRKQAPKQEGAFLIAASIVAAIRLRREPAPIYNGPVSVSSGNQNVSMKSGKLALGW